MCYNEHSIIALFSFLLILSENYVGNQVGIILDSGFLAHHM